MNPCAFFPSLISLVTETAGEKDHRRPERKDANARKEERWRQFGAGAAIAGEEEKWRWFGERNSKGDGGRGESHQKSCQKDRKIPEKLIELLIL